jgi:hypothetical protein
VKKQQLNFAYEASPSYSQGSLTFRKILRHGTDGFTSEGSRATDLYLPRNPYFSAGLVGSVASTLPRPPRANNLP